MRLTTALSGGKLLKRTHCFREITTKPRSPSSRRPAVPHERGLTCQLSVYKAAHECQENFFQPVLMHGYHVERQGNGHKPYELEYMKRCLMGERPIVAKKFVQRVAAQIPSFPIGFSSYRLTRTLPEEIKGSLPSVEELERELGKQNG